MFDKADVGTDWIELKRREDERVAQTILNTAKRAIKIGLSPEQAAKPEQITIKGY